MKASLVQSPFQLREFVRQRHLRIPPFHVKRGADVTAFHNRVNLNRPERIGA